MWSVSFRRMKNGDEEPAEGGSERQYVVEARQARGET